MITIQRVKIMKREYKIFSLFIFVFVILAFLRFPDSRNEMKYLLIVKDSFNNGDIFIIKYLGELYPDKPPLYFWGIKILYIIFGKYSYNISLILLSFLPFLGIIYLGLWQLEIFNKEKYRDEYKILMMTTPFYTGMSIFLRMDMLMTFFICLNLSLFIYFYFNQEKINTKNLVFFYLSLILAVFSKGPVGIIFPLIVELSFLYFESNLGFFKKLKLKIGFTTVLIFFVFWFGLILLDNNGKEYLKMMLGDQTVGRAIKSSSHSRPFYYYLFHIPLTFFPYGFFYLYGIYSFIKNYKFRTKWDSFMKWIFAWTMPTFLFFSILSGKLDIYLLPIFPGVIYLSLIFLEVLEDPSIKIKIKINMKSKLEININKLIKIFQKIIFVIYILLIILFPIYKKHYSAKEIYKYIERNKIEKVALYHAKDLINLKFYLPNLHILEYKEISSLKNGEYILLKEKYLKDVDKDYEKILKREEYVLLRIKE